ncbi:uncharacterized protein LOC114364678 [Ostrinia furnacalis]|uniref:uncharacterized protein LOC114358117 n=1 Tax=Ostrinia furnacalis TaxID=93504 RepID=UPI00103E705A|nr:uncharacterized protein LOC114358117 [Ostrinia furnacalis]XP_028176710.1 uncharacterized protein LOC114364678 [Ostrinia furnacalis]
MKLTTHHHTFIQYVDLNDIEDKINSLQIQLKSYEQRLTNDTFLLYETQIDYLGNKLNKVLKQLRSLEPNRAKRGIVDGLGSVIKSITGNLDHTDAEKYNKVINILKSNQDKVTTEFNNHISLCKEWMSKHNDILTQLLDNQNKINATIETILNSDAYKENSLIKYAKFAQLLVIVSENIEDLTQELIRLENCLAFIRASSTHHSMIDVDVLNSMISKLKVIYGTDRIINLELRQYYEIIKPGSYYTENQIVFIFQFPIISKDVYNLYHLSIVPNKNAQALIPTYPYIATNEIAFMYIETECPKLNHWFLCESTANHQLRTKSDCIQELIVNQILKETCEFSTITLKREAMEKLDDQHYVLSFPHPTKVQLICSRQDYNTLQGSYLITIPVGCHLKTAEFTITNDNDEVKGQPLKLTEIPFDVEGQVKISSHMNLNSINLQELHSIQDKIMMQTPIKIDDAQLHTLYHTTVPFYIVLLSAVALIIVISCRRYNILKCNKKPSRNEQQPPIQKDPEGIPATFSLNVLK